MRVIPENINDEGLKSAYQEADRHTWTKKELEEYDYARMRETDDKAEQMLVEQKAELRKQLEIATNLISLASNNEFIIKATGLTIEQIETLRNTKA